jgi:hypothetical protein
MDKVPEDEPTNGNGSNPIIAHNQKMPLPMTEQEKQAIRDIGGDLVPKAEQTYNVVDEAGVVVEQK